MLVTHTHTHTQAHLFSYTSSWFALSLMWKAELVTKNSSYIFCCGSDIIFGWNLVSRAAIWEPGASWGPAVVGNRSLCWESLGQLRASRVEASWLRNRQEASRHRGWQKDSRHWRLGDRLERSWLWGRGAYKLLASLVRSSGELFSQGFLTISFYCLRNPLFHYNNMKVSMKTSFLQINVCWVHFIVCLFCCSLCPEKNLEAGPKIRHRTETANCKKTLEN